MFIPKHGTPLFWKLWQQNGRGTVAAVATALQWSFRNCTVYCIWSDNQSLRSAYLRRLLQIPSPKFGEGISTNSVAKFPISGLGGIFFKKINTEMCGERPRGGRESVIPHLRNQALGRASWYWCVWDFSVAGLGSCLWLPSSSQNALPPAATESSKGRPPRIEISTQIWTKSSQCSETLPRRKCSSHSTHHPDNRNANPWLVQCVLDATSHTMLQARSLTRCHWRFRYFVPV